MRVSVFGTGYVGLVQAAVLAELGNDVLCMDVDADKIDALREGKVPIFEPGLVDLVRKGLRDGCLLFTTDSALAARHAEIIFIAVGTPSDQDGSADLTNVLVVAGEIGRNVETHCIVACKSTVPVGTCDRVHARISEVLEARGRGDIAVEVISNPEFLKEGSAVADCMRPDRIIIGTRSAAAERKMRELYKPLIRNRDRVIVMDERSAELTKYAANSMLATRISFMNEMATLAELLGADIENVRAGIGSDPRIGYHFIYPGLGYGGSCLPKDLRALIGTAAEAGFRSDLLEAVENRNREQKMGFFNKVSRYFDGQLADRTFALWGLSFKPDTDDMREAPSRLIMEQLWNAGARVRAYDPQAMDECRRIYGERPDLELCATKEDALEAADGLIIATEWKSFRAPSFERIAERLARPVIFDGRNLYDPAVLRRHGIDYHCIGRGTGGLGRPAPGAVPDRKAMESLG